MVSLPLAMGLGALAVAPFGPELTKLGVLAGLYGGAFLSLIAVLAGARGVAIYAPRSLVSFVIASVATDVLVGAAWLPKDDPAVIMCALFLMLALSGVIQVLFALVRLPRLVKFIPAPVMAGFQNAAAITISLSQLHVMFGLASRPAMGGWMDAFGDLKPLQLLLGLLTLVLAYKGQHLIKRVFSEVRRVYARWRTRLHYL